ncbi:hypothetical protein [Nocardioides jiangxiensis]|uniref:Uncharacterized protein n=1 Tax=Nocardioides jiangxiensis TaxID=3064524 RepID=A0ABT9AZV4_9ACTN|nr:hypothetical protein [Nocardioides sp. WY-20]MDO7868000.1 hypothetical protein [Nocardioides sp. WY-20]
MRTLQTLPGWIHPGTAGPQSLRTAHYAWGTLLAAAALFGAAWTVGGEDAVSDNWVGMTVMLLFLLGLIGSTAALAMATYAGLHGEPWRRVWPALATLPAVLVTVVLLELLVFE